MQRGVIVRFSIGFLFPILGLVAESARQAVTSPAGLLRLHNDTPALWLLWLIPFVLAFTAIAQNEGTLPETDSPETKKTKLMLVFLTVCPTLLLIFALFQNFAAARTAHDISLTASLRSNYVNVQEAAQRGDKHAWLAAMGQVETLRLDLAERYPQEMNKTASDWSTLSERLRRTGKMDSKSLRKLQLAAFKMLQRLQKSENLRSDTTGIVLVLGMVGMVGILLKSFDLNRQLTVTENLLQRSRSWLSEVQRLARLGSWELDVVRSKLQCSEEAYRILGVEKRQRSDFSYPNLLDMMLEGDRTVLDGAVRHTVHTGDRFELDMCLTRPDGQLMYLHCTGYPMRDRASKAVVKVVGTILDITERKQFEVRLQELAMTDGLTGLKNHRMFQVRVEAEVTRSRRNGSPVSLLLLDVDKFKAYNDTFGHPAGDDVLKGVAHILSVLARATDFVARYGGEEFAVLLPDTDYKGALRAAERCRKAIEQAAWPLREVTVSIGVATLHEGVPTHAELIGASDRALYRSKHDGRNRVTHIWDLEEEEKPEPIVTDRIILKKAA